MLLVIIISILAFCTIAGIGMTLAGANQSNARALKRAQALTAVNRAEKTRRAKVANVEPNQRRKQIVKTLKEQDQRQRKASLTLSARLQQTGYDISVTQFWVASGVFGVVVLVLLLLAHPPWFVLAGLPFVAAAGAPRWVVSFLSKRRLKAFTAHFADAIDIIVRGIKSGLPVHDCLRIIARESPAPLGPEFQRLVENLSLGLSMEQGLDKVYERVPTNELRFFAIVMAIQQKTGGNLAEALANLSSVLRGRKLMREKIKAMSAEATASAMIIGCLPPGVVGLITVTAPTYMSVMFTDTRGQVMLMGGTIWMCLGIFVMRNMINFKF